MIVVPLALAVATPTVSSASVHLGKGGVYTLSKGIDKTAVAWGSFSDGLNETGWGVLNLRTSDAYVDTEQHKAAGIVEGFLTASQIHPHYLNNLAFMFHGKPVPAAIRTFLATQEQWALQQSRKRAAADPFWAHTAAVMAQFDGLVEGYMLASNAGTVPPLERCSPSPLVMEN